VHLLSFYGHKKESGVGQVLAEGSRDFRGGSLTRAFIANCHNISENASIHTPTRIYLRPKKNWQEIVNGNANVKIRLRDLKRVGVLW